MGGVKKQVILAKRFSFAPLRRKKRKGEKEGFALFLFLLIFILPKARIIS
jgi:hypothetical protein